MGFFELNAKQRRRSDDLACVFKPSHRTNPVRHLVKFLTLCRVMGGALNELIDLV